MEYLTKPVTTNTGKVLINLRLLLNDRAKSILFIIPQGTVKCLITCRRNEKWRKSA